jgi:hypothetical protein
MHGGPEMLPLPRNLLFQESFGLLFAAAPDIGAYIVQHHAGIFIIAFAFLVGNKFGQPMLECAEAINICAPGVEDKGFKLYALGVPRDSLYFLQG